MTDEPLFILNQNPGQDVLHPRPTEECNQDDAKGRKRVDARTAAAMLASGQARMCEHCGGSEVHL